MVMPIVCSDPGGHVAAGGEHGPRGHPGDGQSVSRVRLQVETLVNTYDELPVSRYIL